jgi:hypothetical protein
VGLGLHYQFGEGVPINRALAYALYNLAALSLSPPRPDVPNFTDPALFAKINMNQDAWNLVHEMAKTGNLLKALDQFIDHPPPPDNFVVD